MTEKQKQFCDEYLANGLNATQAYLAVYKNVKSEDAARTNASRLLTNANVREYIDVALAKIHERENDGCQGGHGASDGDRARRNQRISC